MCTISRSSRAAVSEVGYCPVILERVPRRLARRFFILSGGRHPTRRTSRREGSLAALRGAARDPSRRYATAGGQGSCPPLTGRSGCRGGAAPRGVLSLVASAARPAPTP